MPHLLQTYRPFSGDERTRTADPLLAKQVLYQLSYVPNVPVSVHVPSIWNFIVLASLLP